MSLVSDVEPGAHSRSTRAVWSEYQPAGQGVHTPDAWNVSAAHAAGMSSIGLNGPAAATHTDGGLNVSTALACELSVDPGAHCNDNCCGTAADES